METSGLTAQASDGSSVLNSSPCTCFVPTGKLGQEPQDSHQPSGSNCSIVVHQRCDILVVKVVSVSAGQKLTTLFIETELLCIATGATIQGLAICVFALMLHVPQPTKY